MADIELTADCCGETQPTNPKKDLFRRKPPKLHDHLFQLKNPIPEEIKDADEIKKVFETWNYVPYAGDDSHTSHSLLTWYVMLAKLSPTNSSCINKKIEFAVGGKAQVARSVDPEFDIGEDVKPVTPQEAQQYINELKTFFEFEGGVSFFHTQAAWQYEATGNSFVEVSISSVMGQNRVHLRSRKTTNCLFVKTKPGEAKAIAISPKWTKDYLEKHPPRIVPLFPVFVKEGDVLKTIFQKKNGENTWYGRPPSDGADIYKYREVQDELYQVRAAASDFTGTMIFEIEDDDPQYAAVIDDENAIDTDGEKFVEKFEENYTNKGKNPQSVMIVSRPYGSRPMFVFQVAPNTKQAWYKITGEIAENKIIRAHGLSPRFMGIDVANGFSTDVYISDYILNVQPTIQRLHDDIMSFVNSILTQGWQIVGKMEMNQYSLTFSPPIQSTIQEFKIGKPQSQPQPNNSTVNTGKAQQQPNDPSQQ